MLVVEEVVNPQVYLEMVEQVVEDHKVKQGQLTLVVEVVVMMVTDRDWETSDPVIKLGAPSPQ